MLVLKKRRVTQLPDYLLEQTNSKKIRTTLKDNKMDIEFDKDNSMTEAFQGLETIGFLEEKGDQSRYSLNPLYNDRSLVLREERQALLRLVGAILRNYEYTPQEIKKKLSDQAFLEKAYNHLVSLTRIRAIEWE